MPKRIYLNEKELPLIFSGGGIVNGAIISSDESSYAHLDESGDVVIEEIPSDGVLRVGSEEIRYVKGTLQYGILLGGEGGLHPAGDLGIKSYKVVVTSTQIKIQFNDLENKVISVSGKGSVGIEL